MRPAGERGARPPAAARRLITLMLGLYPAAFRERYGAEMGETFAERWVEVRQAGRGAAVLFLLRTSWSLAVAALRERMDRAPAPVFDGYVERAGRPTRHGGFMQRLFEDVRFGLRFLRRHPSFTVVVIATLALGIGMNTAVFSVLYGALFAPLPYRDADRVVMVGRTHPSIAGALLPLSPGNFYDMRERAHSLSPLEGVATQSFVLSGQGDAARFAGAAVTTGLLDMLGVAPARGRGFSAADGQQGAPAVAIVSDGFWRTQLGGDPSAVGRDFRLNDEPTTVIGVMPREFSFLGSVVWVPLRFTEQQRAARGQNYIRMYARLAPRADVTTAAAELKSAWIPLRDQFPKGNENTSFSARTLRDISTQATRKPLMILAVSALFVLLIACANVTNLLLVRSERRQREVGVRTALGAGRWQLARQFLTEGVITAVLGGAAGVAVAWAGVHVLKATFANSVPRSSAVGINAPVLGFTLLASLATGVLVGLAPALRGRPNFDVLREGGRGGTARLSRVGRALVVAEVALAIMLVTGAGLLLKSYAAAVGSDLGFDPEHLLAANFWFPASRYPDNAQVQAFQDQLMTALSANGQITSSAMSSMVPVREFGNNYTEIGVLGRDAKASFVEARNVTAAYFHTMGMKLLSGRSFTEAETRDANSRQVVINRTLAHQLFGDDSPMGWKLSGTWPAECEVIGVVDDVRDFGPDQVPRPTMYFPSASAGNLMVRSPQPVSVVADLLRRAAHDIDPAVAMVRVQPMAEIVDSALAGRRFQLTLIGVFAGTALLLACVGIYGVLAYSVERQTREIGVRMALGARAMRVALQVAWRGGTLALVGVALGVGGALATNSVIKSQLFNVASIDVYVYLAVSALVLLVATLACVVPARRAAVIDPVRALSIE